MGEGFGEGDRDIEHDLSLRELQVLAFALRALDDALDEAHVVRDVELDDPLTRVPGRRIGDQKLWRARSRVSAI